MTSELVVADHRHHSHWVDNVAHSIERTSTLAAGRSTVPSCSFGCSQRSLRGIGINLRRTRSTQRSPFLADIAADSGTAWIGGFVLIG
jgi:hypothetical protein